jgi:hypothetical protein
VTVEFCVDLLILGLGGGKRISQHVSGPERLGHAAERSFRLSDFASKWPLAWLYSLQVQDNF